MSSEPTFQPVRKWHILRPKRARIAGPVYSAEDAEKTRKFYESLGAKRISIVETIELSREDYDAQQQELARLREQVADRVIGALQSIVDAAPDTECVTQPDGSCIAEYCSLHAALQSTPDARGA